MSKDETIPCGWAEDKADWNPNPNCYELLAPFYADIYGEIDAEETVRQWWQLLTDAKLVSASPQALRLLDIGCGPGWQMQAWRELGCNVAGIDSSPTLLASARTLLEGKNGQADLYLANILDPASLPLLPLFDLAVSHFNFFNLFAPEQRITLFRSVARFIRPGGLWITDYTEPRSPPEPVEETIPLPSGRSLERKGQYNCSLECYEQYWKTPLHQGLERFWFGHRAEAATLAACTGWCLRLRKSWHPYAPEAAWQEPSEYDEILVDIYKRTGEEGG